MIAFLVTLLVSAIFIVSAVLLHMHLYSQGAFTTQHHHSAIKQETAIANEIHFMSRGISPHLADDSLSLYARRGVVFLLLAGGLLIAVVSFVFSMLH